MAEGATVDCFSYPFRYGGGWFGFGWFGVFIVGGGFGLVHGAVIRWTSLSLVGSDDYINYEHVSLK